MRANRLLQLTNVSRGLSASWRQFFLIPLQRKVAEGAKWITAAEVSAIFGPLEIIYATNLDVIMELEERFQHWPEQQRFGDVFLKLVPISIAPRLCLLARAPRDAHSLDCCVRVAACHESVQHLHQQLRHQQPGLARMPRATRIHAVSP